MTTLNGFCAPINEEYLGFVSEISQDYTFVLVILLRFLCGKLTFIFVRGVRVWVSAQCSASVSLCCSGVYSVA